MHAHWPGIMSDIPSASTGIASATLIQKRRVIETSSGFSSSSTVTVRGSSAIPQIGHEPGSGRTISGCIGQVYSTRVAGAAGISGFQRHAALGACAGTVLAHLGIHRADVSPCFGGRWRGLADAELNQRGGRGRLSAQLNQGSGGGRLTVYVSLRVGIEFACAARAAEIVGLPGMHRRRLGPFGLDHHSADRVSFHRSNCNG